MRQLAAPLRRGARAVRVGSVAVLAVDANHIAVRVTSPPVPVTLLQLAGVGSSIRVQAVGAAVPESGITEPGN